MFNLIFSFFFFLINFCIYIDFLSNFNHNYINDLKFFPVFLLFLRINLNFFDMNFFFNFFFNIDFFSFIILFLAYVVGFVSLLVLDTRLYWLNIKYYYVFCLFVLVVFFFVSADNIIIFFLLYECLLVPSFFFVYFVSPSRRAIQASIYFLIWTQIGSFLVLFTVLYIVVISGCYNFYSLKFFKFSFFELFFFYFFFFFGFGIKIPIWPFHYWLTKTHVEAPSGFSIYLSGFLVKSALFGFLKFVTNLNLFFNTVFFVIICFFSVFDSSLKMWGQNDLKKLVAYCTIQEMNLIFISFCFGDTNLIICGLVFCLTHAFLSSLMFFLVDCIYKRFHSRNVIEVCGLWVVTPNLALSVILMCVFFSGLPGTLKFIVEFILFIGIIDYSFLFCLLFLFVANYLGLVGFTKNWFNAIFGVKKHFNILKLDLTVKEIYIIFFSFFFLFFFSFFFNFF